MNITQESTGDLTALLKVEVSPEDYKDQVKKTLKDYQQKASMPGFRPGKVPFGMINKMYGKSVLAEEVNKVLTQSLDGYIKENNLKLLGYPLSNIEKNPEINFDTQEQFDFYFDLGFSPEFTVELSDKVEVDYHEIKVEDEKVNTYLEDIQKRFGTQTHPDKVGEEDIVKGNITQLDADGNEMENGIKNETSIGVNFIKDEKTKKNFTGKKVGDKVVFNPMTAMGNATEVASMLNIQKDEAEKLDADFEYTITEITGVDPAKVDKELFDKVYPKDDVQDEAAFREKLREEAGKYYQREMDNFFVHMTMEKLIDDTEVSLPDDFMKRWLLESDEKQTEEAIEKDYPNYVKSLKQQLIINKISEDNEIKIEEQDVRNHVKKSFAMHYGLDLDDEEKSKQLDPIVDSMLQNKEEANKVFDEIFDERLKAVFKEKLNLKNKKVTYDEFAKIVEEHQEKHHKHEH
jgi:trigger factor